MKVISLTAAAAESDGEYRIIKTFVARESRGIRRGAISTAGDQGVGSGCSQCDCRWTSYLVR